MAGYTRNDTSNNIATGNVINAADLDGEFDALVAAFHASTGHTHDGTAANGAPITKIGPVQDLVISTGAITPKTDNTVDLGSSSFEFKDLYIDGTANIDALVADTADINAGTIDGVVIGGSTTAAGSFTTLTTSSTVTLNGGTANGVLYLNGSKQITTGTGLSFDGTQQFGVGQRSTNWKTSYAVAQVGNSALVTSSTYTYLTNNTYIDSSDVSRYLTTGTAVQYSMNRNEGSHTWLTATSGNAGDLVTGFNTVRMKLDVNGYLMLNTANATSSAAINVSTNHQNLIAIGNNTWSQTLVLGTGYDIGLGDYTQLRVPGNPANTAQLLLTSANCVYVGDGYNTGNGQLNINRNGAALVPMLTFNNRTTGTSQYSTGAIAFQAYRDVRDPCYVGLIDVQRYQLSAGLNSQGHMRFFAGAEGKTYAEIVAQTANIYIDGYNGSVGVNTNSPASFSRFAVIGGAGSNVHTTYLGDGGNRHFNFMTNTTGGAYNSLTAAGDVLLYAGAQYQPMTIGTHDGGGIRFVLDATYIGAGSGGIRTVFANAGYQSTNGYVESKTGDTGTAFNTINTSAALQQYYVVHDGAAVAIGNARANNFKIVSGSSAAHELQLSQDVVRIYDNTTATRASVKTEVFTITSGTGGTTVNLAVTANYTGLIAVFGSGNDTSAAIFYVAGASEYDYETIGTLVSNGFGVAYTGNTSIALNSSLGNPLTMTMTSSTTVTRTYVVYYLGAI